MTDADDRLGPMGRAVLYRYFDAGGRLLYVGICDSLPRRHEQHRRNAPWFSRVARMDAEWHEDRGAALAAEKEAIRNEGPVHNIRCATAFSGADAVGICIRRDHWELLNQASLLREYPNGVRESVPEVLAVVLDEMVQRARPEAA